MPGAVGPDQADPLAGAHPQVDASQHLATRRRRSRMPVASTSMPRCAHSSYPDAEAAQQHEEDRRADDRGDDADGDLARDARDEVGEDEERGAEERRERQDEARVRPDEQAHDVRHDEPDEADEPCQRHGRRRDERGQPEEDGALAAHVDAQVAGGVIAEQQRVERAGAREDDARCRRR